MINAVAGDKKMGKNEKMCVRKNKCSATNAHNPIGNTHKFKLVLYQFMMYMRMFNKLQSLPRTRHRFDNSN